MLQHIIKLSFRSFLRHKSTFLINLVGLSTGLACVLLIYMWGTDELSVDRFHEKEQQLYKAMINYELPNGIQTWEYSPAPLGKALVEEMPEVELSTITNQDIFRPQGVLVEGDKTLDIHGLFIDEYFFDVFSYPVIQGNANQLLIDKNSIIITEPIAAKFFDTSANALGKTIKWKNRFFDQIFTITAVVAAPPASSTMQFEALVHFDLLAAWESEATDWNSSYAENYLLLKQGTDISAFNEKLSTYLRPKGWEPSTLFVQQYAQQYLYGVYEDGIQVGGRISYVQLFFIIALFILAIACINFMNLSTAQASKKMKEIGVKKTVGAGRTTLMLQFLTESLLMALLSLNVALFLVKLLLPQFNQITGKALELSFNPTLLLGILGIVLLTGLLAGSYPAFYLSGFKPVLILNGKRQIIGGEKWLREGLVVLQFALSVIFIVGVLVTNQQMSYIQSKHLGYERSNIITFKRAGDTENMATFLAELERISGVEQASNMYWSVLDGTDSQGGYSWRGQEEDKDILFQAPRIGYDVIETLGMEIVEGRSFSKELKDDFTKIVLNEAAVEMMGLENPVGARVRKGRRNIQEREVIGVVKDFHYGSIHKKVEPMVLRFRSNGSDIMIRLENGTEATTIPKIAQVYTQFHPDYNFNYTFLDKDYQALYESESQIAVLAKYFSGLAIIISCLGLFGLVAFTAERRKKEIGIRRVLGAGVSNIIGLLSKDFLKLIAIAFILASPIAYYSMHSWLNNFAYHTEIQAWVFALAGALALGIAFVIISIRGVDAALSNPVNALRNE